jgi:phenylalanyl-tRNA synthetase beta chain
VAVPQLRPLPRFPAIRRDLSLIVSEATRFDALQKLIDQANLPDLEDVEYVGSYRGKPLVKGQKSITISLVFRSANQTLTSQAVDTAVKRVVSDAGARIGATLRA